MALRIVLLEVDGANLDKNLRLVLDEDISKDRDIALSLSDTCNWMRKIREAPARGGKDSSSHSNHALLSSTRRGMLRRRLSMYENGNVHHHEGAKPA